MPISLLMLAAIAPHDLGRGVSEVFGFTPSISTEYQLPETRTRSRDVGRSDPAILDREYLSIGDSTLAETPFTVYFGLMILSSEQKTRCSLHRTAARPDSGLFPYTPLRALQGSANSEEALTYPHSQPRQPAKPALADTIWILQVLELHMACRTFRF